MDTEISPIRFSIQFVRTIIIIFCIVFDTPYAMNKFSTKVRPVIGFSDAQVLTFDLNAPDPVYPTGGTFGKGFIDLGGLEVFLTEYFLKVWDTVGGEKGGATFYQPFEIPLGFHLLGHYCRPNGKPFLANVLMAKDTTGDPNNGALKSPIDYTLVWTSSGLNIGQQEDGYIWQPIPPIGYKAVGQVVTKTLEKPPLDKYMCVRKDFTYPIELDTWIWGVKTWLSSVDVYTTKPVIRELSVPVGTFLALHDVKETRNLACLKMVRNDPYSAMPNGDQINAMVIAYSPRVYFHPDEKYFPSTVSWFFENGAELHETHIIPAQPVINDGENLPTNGTADDAFLDLPPNEPEKDKVKKGFLRNATAYVHVKPALGGTFTDLAIWLYYPFNGGGRFQFGPFNINLGKIGEHVSDWEHITLRVDNFRGILKAIYLSQHAAGKWLTAPELEYVDNGTTPVVYASLYGHAHYETPSIHLHGKSYIDPKDIEAFYELLEMDSESRLVEGEKLLGFGARDDTAKSKYLMDISSMNNVVCVDYEKSDMEPWLYYTGRWGAKITYKFAREFMKAVNVLPQKMKALCLKMLHTFPPELLGEEGPTGPKMKDNWTGDEKVKFEFF